MPDPIVFDSQTPRFGLPLLYAGQAQKEAFVNEATARTDALLHGAIEGEANAPPATPVEGECWMIGTAPTGSWSGKAGQIAAFSGGNWLYVSARDGLHLLNRATGQEVRYHGQWRAPARPAVPSGGTTVDTEARAAIAALLEALTVAGIVPAA